MYSVYQCAMLHMSVITQDGQFALLLAAYSGPIEVVQLLVKAGANLDLQNKVCEYVDTHDVHKYCEIIKRTNNLLLY